MLGRSRALGQGVGAQPRGVDKGSLSGYLGLEVGAGFRYGGVGLVSRHDL